jgi:hypothetical protein
MKRHFVVGESQVACGRNNHDLVATEETNRVTCIKCRSSQLFEHAVNREINFNAFEKSIGLFPAEFWKNYTSSLPGYNRLPRGVN